MTVSLQDAFADTSFWIALVVNQEQYHDRAQKWSVRITGRITTTIPVLFETANALARPAWRDPGAALIDYLQQRSDVQMIAWSPKCGRAPGIFTGKEWIRPGVLPTACVSGHARYWLDGRLDRG